MGPPPADPNVGMVRWPWRAAVRALALVLTLAAAGTAPVAAQQRSASVLVERDLVYGERRGRSLLLDAYLPDQPGSDRRAVILVHGGGWSRGDKGDLQGPARSLAEMGWVAFSIDYTLTSPRWPTELLDVQLAIRWVREHARRFGIDPAAIGLVGASAGAHLAVLAAVWGEGSRSEGSRVAAAVSWSGPMDLAALASGSVGSPGPCATPPCPGGGRVRPTVASFVGCPFEACPQDYREASPITHVDASDPPVLLANSTEELIPIDQAERMAAALDAVGVPNELVALPGRRHAIAYADDVWDETVAFLDRWVVPRDRSAFGRLVPWLAVAVGVVALLAVGTAVLVLRRRRSGGA